MGVADTNIISSLTDKAADAKKLYSSVRLEGKWCLVKFSAGDTYLIFEKAGGVALSNLIYRFSKSSSRASAHIVQSDDCVNYFSTLNADNSDWYKPFWEKFWEEAGLPAAGGYAVQEDGFYDATAGAKHRVSRPLTPRSKPVDLGADRRKFSIAHLRIKAGIRGYPGMIDYGDYGANMDAALGIRYNDLKPYDEDSAEYIFPRGGVTVAYFVTKPPAELEMEQDVFQVKYFMAVCSLKDRYDRRMGLRNAITKMEAEKPEEGFVKEKFPFVIDKSSGALDFTGQGVFLARINPSSVIRMENGHHIFKAPFFPRGHCMSSEILAHAQLSFTDGTFLRLIRKSRVVQVLEMAQFTLVVTLAESGYEDTRAILQGEFKEVQSNDMAEVKISVGAETPL